MTPAVQLHRPAVGGEYKTVATPADDYSRILATTVLSPYGWSIVGRTTERVRTCGGCIICGRPRGSWTSPSRSVLKQFLFTDRAEAEQWLAYVAGIRLREANA